MIDDWEVPCSDEEDDSTSCMPPPKTIVELYNRLDKGEIFDLVVTIVPRKDPQEIKLENSAVKEKEEESENPIEEMETESLEPNEFDFDSQAVAPIKRFTPKRTPSRPQIKKVARMDKVCSNIIKYQKMDEAQLELEKQKNPS